MGDKPIARLGALALLLVVVGNAPALAAFTDEVRSCRDSVARSGSKYAQKALAIVARCHGKRLATPALSGTDCNDLAQATVAIARDLPSSVFASDPTAGACSGVDPGDAHFTSCGAPCEATIVTDWASVDQCLQCMLTSHVEDAGSESIGAATVPPAQVDLPCARYVPKLVARTVKRVLGSLVGCLREADHPNACLEVPYPDQIGRRKERGNATRKILKLCGSASFVDVGSCATAMSDASCVIGNAELYGEVLGYDLSRMQGAKPPAAAASFSALLGQCALDTGGFIQCAGREDLRPLGRFAQVAGPCGVRVDGSIDCWSENQQYPAAEAPTGNFVQVSATERHACAIAIGGNVQCWGDIDPPPPGTFSELSSGSQYTCGLATDGSLACWGNDNDGQSSPPAGTYVQVSAGVRHACAVRSDGIVECWGRNLTGEASPLPGVFTSVSAGGAHTCGKRADESVECWGNDSAGESSPPSGAFAQVLAESNHTCGIRPDSTMECWGAQFAPSDTTFTRIASSPVDACAIRSDAAIECWGSDNQDQSNVPVGAFTDVTVGSRHVCALRSDATVECWGSDDGDGRATPPAGTFVQLSAGTNHTCGVRSDSTVECWGADAEGQASPLGGVFTQVSCAPSHSCGLRADGSIECWGVEPTTPTGSFTSIAVAYSNGCALRANGSAECWGTEFGSRLPYPYDVFTKVISGEELGCGLRQDGSVDCWNRYSFGHTFPPPGPFIDISVGFEPTSSVCGVRPSGRAICW